LFELLKASINKLWTEFCGVFKGTLKTLAESNLNFVFKWSEIRSTSNGESNP
jgi:hypothetical protein